MEREAIRGDSLFVIHQFLAPGECEQFISRSEQAGYEAATINTGRAALHRPDVRNNSRIIFDDAELAANWFQRAQPFLPQRQGQWALLGLNERFRFYRYDIGESFKRHYDASFQRRYGEQSFLTLMVYLNDGYTGGTTAFYHANDQPMANVEPQAGMALVFDHDQVHEGAPVTEGRKYVLRTDVMYRRV
jgi:predicted 2-oxoglutarate/Fe(II)-dependent dioxygenase YbiX